MFKRSAGLSLGIGLVSLGSLLAMSGQQSGQTVQQVARKSFASTVLLVMEDANGRALALGSGFFVSSSEVATNLHVLEHAARGYAKLIGDSRRYDLEGVAGVDTDRDLAIVRLSAARSPALAIGDSDALQVGDPVYAVGNPQGLEGTFSQGIVSSIRHFGQDQILQITAPISPGSSGGPVLNAGGEVVGISVATFANGQNLNFAIPSKYLKRMLPTVGPLTPLSQRNSSGRKSILADAGARSTDGVVGDQLVWQYPFGLSGQYTFSLRNQLRDGVRRVYCLVIFYDAKGQAIDVDEIRFGDVIPPGLARRASGEVDKSVQELTTSTSNGANRPYTKVEIRVLDFEIIR